MQCQPVTLTCIQKADLNVAAVELVIFEGGVVNVWLAVGIIGAELKKPLKSR